MVLGDVTMCLCVCMCVCVIPITGMYIVLYSPSRPEGWGNSFKSFEKVFILGCNVGKGKEEKEKK